MSLKFLAVATLVIALILAAIPNLIWLPVYFLGRLLDFRVPYASFGWTAFGLVVFCVLTMAYGCFVGRWMFRVSEIEYANADIPEAFDGYRIIHISDLHLSTFDDNRKQLDKIVGQINELDADLVCFTGDLVTIGTKEAEPYTGQLKAIKAKDGVVSVLGNHDFMIYSYNGRTEQGREASVDSLTKYERETLGWKLLRNESLSIDREGVKITLIGVDNGNCSDQGFRTINKSDLPKALEGTDGFRILLSHDPSQWEAEVLGKTDIPLMLSGHTHAAQVKLFGWTPANWVFRQTYGRYDCDGQTLYVNIGLGCTAPVRIGARPEITVITLKR